MVIGVMKMVMGLLIEILKMVMENVDTDGEFFLLSSEEGCGSDYISSP